MQPLIGFYEYNYYPGSAPDRIVSFFENNDHSVVAHVEGRLNGEWKKIAVLPEDKILVAGEKLSGLIKRYNESIDLEKPMEVIPDRKFTQLSLEEKRWLITQLYPKGPYDLVICYTYGDNPEFEAISHVGFSERA